MVIFGKEAKVHFISLYICYLSLHLYPLPYSDFPGLMFFVCSFDDFQEDAWTFAPLCYKGDSM